MAAKERSLAETGAHLIWISATLGTAVSLNNYMTPLSGIDGTPGALLVIASTLILCVAGLALSFGELRGAPWVLLTGACLLGIAGTAFAAYLLNSRMLLILMYVCVLGWCLHVLTGSRATP